jgi:hypothetical protein
MKKEEEKGTLQGLKSQPYPHHKALKHSAAQNLRCIQVSKFEMHTSSKLI